MKIDRFYKNSLILTFSNLFTGIIGFVFSIILSRNLGTEGLGLYGLIMPVYGLLLCLVSDGLITAASKTSAAFWGKKDFRNLSRTMHTVFLFFGTWSILIAVIVLFNATWIGTTIIKDSRSIMAIRILCPALVFVSLSAILKGYFYGISQFKVAALIDTFEKLIRVVAFLSLLAVFTLSGIQNTVTGAYLAVTFGEGISFILLFFFYKLYRKKWKPEVYKRQNRLQLLADIFVITLPLGLEGILSSLFTSASILILPRRLMMGGISYSSALSLIGMFKGMALTIAFFPMIIVFSMSTVLVADISLRPVKKNDWATESRIKQVLRISCLVGISTVIICLCIPDELGRLLYSRDDLGNYIRFAALSVLIDYLAMPTIGILNGLGKQNAILINSLIVSIETLILIYILTGIPAIHIYGYGIMIMVTGLTLFLLNMHEIQKIFSLFITIRSIFSYCIVGVLSFIALMLAYQFFPSSMLALKTVFITVLGFVLVFGLAKLFIVDDSN